MPKKNILLLMTDQHRGDHVGFGRRSRWSTPNIDRIAAEGIGFTGCVTPSPMCQPARAALMTGKYPRQIGMLAMAGDLHPEHPTFTGCLQKAGYHVSWIGKLHLLQGWDWYGKIRGGHDLVHLKPRLREAYGIDHLWEASGKFLIRRDYCDWAAQLRGAGLLAEYYAHLDRCGGGGFQVEAGRVDRVIPWPFDESHYCDIAIADQAIAALRSRESPRPFFLACSFCGPHVPYDPPSRFLEGIAPSNDPVVAPAPGFDGETLAQIHHLQRGYKGMLRCIDEQVGRILAVLAAEGLMESTTLIFTSDHGEMLGDHGLLQKGFPHTASTAIPLAIRHPGAGPRGVNHAPVELTDVTATILDAAGLDPKAALSKPWPAFHDLVPSRSLLPVATGECDRIRDFAYCESDANWHAARPDPDSCWQMLVDHRWKYVRRIHRRDSEPENFVRESLFDLEADPDETRDLADDPGHEERLAAFRRNLDYVQATTPPAQTGWAPLVDWRKTRGIG
jgi:choline-sulfatase